MQAAFTLFSKSGIESVTLSEVARQAQVGDATIYRYFQNKPRLVQAALILFWQSLSVQMEQKIEPSVPGYHALSGFEQIALLLEVYRDLYTEGADYILFTYEAKLYLQRNDITFSSGQLNTLMERVKSPFLQALDKGLADGSIVSRFASADLFYAIWGMIRGYIVKIVLYDSLCKEENFWEPRYDVVKAGILSALQHGWASHPSIL